MKRLFYSFFILLFLLSLSFAYACNRSSDSSPVEPSKQGSRINNQEENKTSKNETKGSKSSSGSQRGATNSYNNPSSKSEESPKGSSTEVNPGKTDNIPPASNNNSTENNNSSTNNNSIGNNNSTTNNNNSSQDTTEGSSLPKLPNNYAYELSSELEEKLLAAINAERNKAGVVSLSENSILRKSARYKATEMLQYDYFAHSSPYSNEPSDIAKSFGHSFTTFGENLFTMTASNASYLKANLSADSIVNQWMNSEGHKKNILNINYRKTGIGVVIGSNGKCFISEMFSD